MLLVESLTSYIICNYQLHHVDGLTMSGVKELLKAGEHSAKDFITLTGDSGRTWGMVKVLSILFILEESLKSPDVEVFIVLFNVTNIDGGSNFQPILLA